ncbi:MAG: hypothetical protein NBV68_07710 [Erythrobacter sp.]|uniref:hypothetical protein n=1 Tax=Erythrobacter sp. TaxID=1042 RepID=UPI0025D42017|nr:hypothetical protein [Erythrobacter sp.]MCL9999252.1 hypothetical protein [Erythrobacter sp.]
MTSQSQNPSASEGQQSGITEELKQDGSRLADDVMSRAKQEAEGRKNEAADLAGSASSALDTAAQDLRENADVPDWMASALQQAARSIEGLASHIQGRSIDELGEEVSEFARRNPGTFLAASAAIGVAASRVLSAGVDKKRHNQGAQGGGNQSAGGGSGDSTDWPADEYVRPTSEGGYEPAFFGSETGGQETIR